MRFCLLLAVLLCATVCHAVEDGLDELNARRVRQGLYPFQRDDALTAAAMACSSYRAAHRIAAHTFNDFAFVPSGAFSDGAGCAAAEDSWGWLSCYMDDRSHAYAGAAWERGMDGQRYMHLFVSTRPNGPVRKVAKTAAAIVGGGKQAVVGAFPPGPSEPWKGNVVVFFTAKWCGPCQALQPMKLRLHAKALQHGWRIYDYDIDRTDFQWKPAGPIAPIPLVILYRDKVEIRRWRGAEISEQQIEEAVK